MSNYPSENPQLPEDINISTSHPLKDFLVLLAGGGCIVGLLVLSISLLATYLSPLVPFSWERQVLESWQQPAVDEPYQQEFERLLRVFKLVEKQSELETDMTLHIHHMDSEIPNAFATLGGHIFVTQGLLSQVQSDTGLAMVIAHEIAHVKHRHPIQALSRGVLIQLVMAVILGDNGMANSLISPSGTMLALKFNRDMEYQADETAVAIIKRSFENLDGADEFFVTALEEHGSSGWSDVFQTHPDMAARLVRIRQALK
jgi:Zn-dependent protease with chaperone function